MVCKTRYNEEKRCVEFLIENTHVHNSKSESKYREWKTVKPSYSDHHNKSLVYIGDVWFPPEWVGKRCRFKVELVEFPQPKSLNSN